MTSQIEQQALGLQGHLPECFMAARLGVDTYAPDVLAQMKRAGCICHRLRACEQRVLDAAREAVAPKNLRSAYLVSLNPQEQRIAVSALELAATAIDALRVQPADQTGYNLPDAQ